MENPADADVFVVPYLGMADCIVSTHRRGGRAPEGVPSRKTAASLVLKLGCHFIFLNAFAVQAHATRCNSCMSTTSYWCIIPVHIYGKCQPCSVLAGAEISPTSCTSA